ncbi:Cof-type HAD-IIB family hydrolase [Neobacillus mesonae]|nr:Cof-type HAD-IIB family hydrolase [Neobacillus mesonae]
MKLIAIDLDGTLLNSESKISPENANAIRKAQSLGVHVTIATGRSHADVRAICKEAGLITPVIGANGATTHDEYSNRIESIPMSRDTAMNVLEWLDQNKFYYEVLTDTAIYSPNEGHQLMSIEIDRALSANPGESLDRLLRMAEKQYEQTGIVRIPSYRSLPEDAEIYNILSLSFDKQKLELGRARFQNDPNVTMVISADHNFEVEHPEASKGNALKKMAAKLGIALEETMAIGDSNNDVSMLSIAGHSVAMGNAHPAIQDLAKEVTLTNVEHGVAYAIERKLAGLKLEPSIS